MAKSMTDADPTALRTAMEPRRLQILELIWDQERGVSEIAARLPVSVAAVSQHLAKLRDAGLDFVRVVPGSRDMPRDVGALSIVALGKLVAQLADG